MFVKHPRAVAAGLGLGAVIVAAALTISQPDNEVSDVTIPVAGSGSAPVNTSYVQPSVGGMNMGGTAVETTPPSTLEISKAVPAVKAGH